MAYTIDELCCGCEVCKSLCPMDAIVGEKESQQAINPELCIECGSCGRICPKNAVLDQYGMRCEIINRSEWGIPIIDLDLCTSCISCTEICPVECLVMPHPEECETVHQYPYLTHEGACIGCGLCELKCPVEAIKMTVVKKETAFTEKDW